MRPSRWLRPVPLKWRTRSSWGPVSTAVHINFVNMIFPICKITVFYCTFSTHPAYFIVRIVHVLNILRILYIFSAIYTFCTFYSAFYTFYTFYSVFYTFCIFYSAIYTCCTFYHSFYALYTFYSAFYLPCTLYSTHSTFYSKGALHKRITAHQSIIFKYTWIGFRSWCHV